MANEEEELSFSNTSINCCVSFVDVVGSTRITANIGNEKIGKFYSIFLNTMALIVVKSFPSFFEDYRSEIVGECSVTGLKQTYPVYSIISKYQQPRPERLSLLNKVEKLDVAVRGYDTTRESRYSHNTILLVDDESDALYTYKALLEEEGYRVDTFSDPEEALKHFAQTTASYYDLVLLDIRMPRLNGLQLYYRMKSIEMNIQIIFVSALDAADDELVSVLPGIKLDKHIIKKPIKRELFLDKIKETILSSSKKDATKNGNSKEQAR
jgi:CheY-like chemotaxis protein